MVLDQLESRVLLSVAQNNGYALDAVASFGTGVNAQIPQGALAEDSNGDIFGASESGGTDHDGAIFEIPAGSDSVQTLVSFNGTNGEEPFNGGLFIDSDGNLYGATDSGGADGAGTVFEVPESNRNTIAVLGSFASGLGTSYGVVVDSSGDVFGTTETGGAHGTGSIWEIPFGETNVANVGGAATRLASFAANPGTNSTGANPNPFSTMLIQGSTLYGTTGSGGADGDGTIFSESGGTITDVGDFTAPNSCESNLVLDGSGDLFGTSSTGGSGNGYIFELASGTSTVVNVASFDGTDGSNPQGRVSFNDLDELVGTTSSGGSDAEGAAFLLPTFLGIGSLETMPNIFGEPTSGLIADGNGNLFGTESEGGENGEGSLIEFSPVHLVISGVPSLFNESPSTISPTVTLEGPTGNTIIGDDSLVTLTMNNGGTVINNTATSINGVATFPDLAVTTPGTDFGLTANDANDDADGSSDAFTVAPQPDETSTHLVFLTQPGTNTGSLPTVTVGIENAENQVVTDDDSIITLNESDGPGDLDGTLIAQAVNGEASFTGLSVDEAGTYVIEANDDDLSIAETRPFVVTAVPTALEITSLPTQPLTAGMASARNVVVQLEDQFDDPMNTGSNTVQLSAANGVGKALSLGSAAMHNGVATFKHIKIDTASQFELGASSKGLLSDFEGIEVNPAAGANIAFVLGTPVTSAGAQFSISVQVLDKFGNVDYLDDSDITLTLTGAGGGTLSGNTTVAVDEGVANFTGLSISAMGKYKLVATDSALHKTITTKAFIVGPTATEPEV
jgi:uncharacterized repeat protein (TIGR03803 family)